MVSIRAGFTFTAEDEEMLNAAHAAMYFWSIVGNANNQAHAVAANVASAGGNTQDHKQIGRAHV